MTRNYLVKIIKEKVVQYNPEFKSLVIHTQIRDWSLIKEALQTLPQILLLPDSNMISGVQETYDFGMQKLNEYLSNAFSEITADTCNQIATKAFLWKDIMESLNQFSKHTFLVKLANDF